MTVKTPRAWTTLGRPPGIAGVEVYRGVCTSSYPRYVPEDYKLGVMARGGQYHVYRNGREFAPPGSLLVVQPGEPVAGSAVDETGFPFRILAIDPRLLREAAAGLGLRTRDGPDFATAIVRDARLAARFTTLHRALEMHANAQQATELASADGSLAEFLIDLIARHATARPRPRPRPACHPAVGRAREYLNAHYASAVSLEELARISGMANKFRLARLFTNDVGVPPHAYQLQVRMARAKEMLAAGRAVAEVAFATGFGDQSHFTRQFRRRVGVPPGAYQRAYLGA